MRTSQRPDERCVCGPCRRRLEASNDAPAASRAAGRRDAAGRLARDSQSAQPRVRSGLAYAAGFAGLLCLFGPSYSSFIFDVCGLRGFGGAALVSLWGLWSPAALILSYTAAASLDRSSEKVGRLPAMVGLLIGLPGTFDFLAVFMSWLKLLG